MSRELVVGMAVFVANTSPNAIAPQHAVAGRTGLLVRPYPGGRYDGGSTMWVVRCGETEAVADESMMTCL